MNEFPLSHDVQSGGSPYITYIPLVIEFVPVHAEHNLPPHPWGETGGCDSGGVPSGDSPYHGH